jgi:prepilin-type N-terminal cleavage/methylation domain-containing protein
MLSSPIRRGSRTRSKQAGFSMLEMIIVVVIILIGGAMFFMNVVPAMNSARNGNAYDQVLSVMRRAHDEAVSENRVYVVNFIAPNTVTVTQNTPTGAVLTSETLPTGITFTSLQGFPTNSPPGGTGYGTGKVAIDFGQSNGGGGTTVYFYPDGSAHDAAGNLNSGSVYLARPSDLSSARAITLAGATGRIRGWKLVSDASAWSPI